jgi:hypothetical protein
MFTAAAAHLRALGHTILGGVLAPSSEEWVSSKLGKRQRTHLILSLVERVHLCRLAVANVSDVAMHVCDWGWASSGNIMREIRDRLPVKEVVIVELAGSDVMMKPRKSLPSAGRMLVGFARADAKPDVVARFAADCEREAKTQGASSRHILRATPTAAISSTYILDAMFPSTTPSSSPPTSSTRVPKPPSVTGMLHPDVAKWLSAKWSTPPHPL